MRGLNVVLGLLCGLAWGSAFGFPDAIRRGYPNCGTCHFAPLGSGPLTPYGKGTSGEIFGSYETDTPTSETLIYGLDIRRLVMTESEPILMQTEAHLGITAKGISIVGSVNEKYPQALWASYRREGLSVRIGRFRPSYAIPYDDHTVSMLSNGKAALSNTAEMAWATGLGELVVSRMVGDSRYSEGSVLLIGRDDAAVTGNIYLGKRCKAGATALGSGRDRYTYAGHIQCGITSQIYNIGEVSKNRDFFSLIGWEALKGFHLRVSSTGTPLVQEHRIGFRWLPIANLEMIGEATKDRLFLVSHLWF